MIVAANFAAVPPAGGNWTRIANHQWPPVSFRTVAPSRVICLPARRPGKTKPKHSRFIMDRRRRRLFTGALWPAATNYICPSVCLSVCLAVCLAGRLAGCTGPAPSARYRCRWGRRARALCARARRAPICAYFGAPLRQTCAQCSRPA